MSWNWRAVSRWVAAGAAVTLVSFAAAEGLLRAAYAIRNSMADYVPLPYVIGHDYGPVPPWLKPLLILAPDETLMWKNRPNLSRRYLDVFQPAPSEQERLALLRRFLPRLPDSVSRSAAWEITLNSEGYRGRERGASGRGPAVRIVCLGDSWTFGMNVSEQQAYPRRLEDLLREKFPGNDFEVLNRGVLGYSSYQGLQLLRSRLAEWKPDVAVIGFAMNDSKSSVHRDKDMAQGAESRGLGARMESLLEASEVYRLLHYSALVLKHNPNSIGEHLEAEVDDHSEPADYSKPWVRVPLGDYQANTGEMIRLLREAGTEALLVYNEFWENSPYRSSLQRISAEQKVPLVDSSSILRRGRNQMETDLERSLDLGSCEGEAEVVFRVYMGKAPVPRAVYIVAPHPKLGDLTPNKVAMRDDGTRGDQRVGDSVWSYAASLPPGSRLPYVYTNSGGEGKWEGLDVPHLRELEVAAGAAGKRVCRPIDSFGEVYMQADSWHPNASGYELIARGVAEAILQTSTITNRRRR